MIDNKPKSRATPTLKPPSTSTDPVRPGGNKPKETTRGGSVAKSAAYKQMPVMTEKKSTGEKARQDNDTPDRDIESTRKPLKSGNSIVPPENIAGSTLSMVIGIMAFLASLTLGGVIMVNQVATGWQTDISREITIQIKPSDKTEMDQAIRDASALVLSFEGVSKVTVLDKEANTRLLEPWLGSGLDLAELPIPRILTVTLEEGRHPDFVAMRERLMAEVPGSSLDDHRAWVDRLTNMAFATVMIGVAIFSLVMIATILTVVFATRGAMASNREVVEVLHFVGADNTYIAGQFQKHFLVLGLRGAVVGAATAVLLFYALSWWSSNSIATPEGDQISALFGTFAIGMAGYLGIFMVLFIIAVLTAITSRITVHRYVGQLHRHGHTKKSQ